MNAVYMMVDTVTLDTLVKLENKELVETILNIEELKRFESVGIAKNWDIIHYYLTGVSASTPIENDKLSEAIVGVHNFLYDDDADFITCTESGELAEIIDALKHFDINANLERLNKSTLKKAKLYPKGVEETREDDLLNEIKNDISSLLQFYEKALKSEHHVIVSIL